MNKIASTLSSLSSLLFPTKCACCKNKEENKIFCEKCLSEIEKSSIHHEKYKRYIHKYNNCIDDVVFSYFYKGYKGKVLTDAIFALKKYNKYHLFEFFSSKVTDTIKNDKFFSKLHFDFVTNVPRKGKSISQYGYDHSAILAKSIAKNLKVPYKSFLKHLNEGEDQKYLNFNERFENIKDKFVPLRTIKNNEILNNTHILIIDDVFTTGATMSECAKVLKTCGATKIYVAVIAKTR